MGRAVKLASLPPREDSTVMKNHRGARRGPTKRQARAWVARTLIVIALVFIVVSVSQIIRAVFGAPRAEAATTEDVTCGVKLRVLEAALERASDVAARAPEAAARAAFDKATSPDWDDPSSTEQLCASTSRSRDAWTALLRLRRTLEGRVEKDAREVDPVRRDFEARLP